MASLLQTAKENDGAEPEVSHLLSTSGTASFLDFIDQFVMVVYRDGRKMLGILRSYDQYGNMVLQHAFERIYVKSPKHQHDLTASPFLYTDVLLGATILRGDNVLFIGSYKDKRQGPNETKNKLSQHASNEVVLALSQAESEKKAEEAELLRSFKLERQRSLACCLSMEFPEDLF